MTSRWPQALQGKAIDARRVLLDPAGDRPVRVHPVLQDDKQTQPAENLAPLVRNDYLAKVDKTAFEKVLNDVSAKITTDQAHPDGRRGRGQPEGRRRGREGVPPGAGDHPLTLASLGTE